MSNHGLAWIENENAQHERTYEFVKGPHDYPGDPVGYARNILRFDPTPDQITVANALQVFPHRVLAPSGHKYGKSACAGWLINWFYDSFDPSVCISTSPKMDSVKRIVWKEVRRMRLRAGLGDLQPRSPEMSDAPDHVAFGMTAASGEGFQGNHELKSFFIFDEACGIDPVFWSVTRTMFKPEAGHFWLALFNPTDTTSQAFIEDHSTDDEGNPLWTTVRMDCLQHPNIIAQLAGQEPPIPSAVTLSMINEWISAWCDPLHDGDYQNPINLEWPPGSGKWYKQGPEFQARCRGMWPEGGTYAVWSEVLWRAAENAVFMPTLDVLPEIGCDVARYGDDYTSFHVRWGDSSYHHEAQNGWSTVRTENRIIELCREYAALATAQRPGGATPIKPEQIAVKIDDDGVGGGVTDILQSKGHFVTPVGAGQRSLSGRYPNKRSELWFQLAERAREGRLGLGRIDKLARNRMRQQAMATVWALNPMGLRVIEPKENTKAKIGRSPDDMDSANLAFYSGFDFPAPEVIGEGERRPLMDRDRERGSRRRLFG